MAVYEFEGKRPMVGRETYISESAEIIGEVAIGRGCYIGPGAKIKGDYGKVVIGDRTSVQENCVLHARPGDGCVVGNMVNVGLANPYHKGQKLVTSDADQPGKWLVIADDLGSGNCQAHLLSGGRIGAHTDHQQPFRPAFVVWSPLNGDFTIH